jgi:hypothetical protein
MRPLPRRSPVLALERLESREVPNATITTLSPPTIVTGSGVGGGEVRVFNATTGTQTLDLFPFGQGFTGGVNVATADFNGDHIPDVVAGMASGGSQVVVLDGTTGAVLLSLTAFDPAFTGGVNVAAGYVTGGYTPDIVVGVAGNGGPRVAVFDGSTGAMISSFYAYDPNFAGGVRVATMDIGDATYDDIITGAGPGGGPEVKVFDGASGAVVRDFFAFAPTFRGGVTVAGIDWSQLGFGDIITGAGTGGGPEVKVFDGMSGAVVQEFFAYDPNFRGGVTVAGADINSSDTADVITGPGVGGGPVVQAFNGQTGAVDQSFFAFDSTSTGGISVAAAPAIFSITVPPGPLGVEVSG